MALFRKKPVMIEAMQYGPYTTPSFELMDFIASSSRAITANDNGIHIETLEGTMTASVGDWIIKGVHGEFYPCKPDIFAATYEPATPNAKSPDAQ